MSPAESAARLGVDDGGGILAGANYYLRRVARGVPRPGTVAVGAGRIVLALGGAARKHGDEAAQRRAQQLRNPRALLAQRVLGVAAAQQAALGKVVEQGGRDQRLLGGEAPGPQLGAMLVRVIVGALLDDARAVDPRQLALGARLRLI